MLTMMEKQFRRDNAYHLANLCKKYRDLDRYISDDNPITPYWNRYRSVSEQLYHEEADNLGFSKEAHLLRKEWRSLVRKMTKIMTHYIKNAKDFDREWSRPRTQYILTETGEIHNGLYWTIKELIHHPRYMKFKFKRMI